MNEIIGTVVAVVAVLAFVGSSMIFFWKVMLPALGWRPHRSGHEIEAGLRDGATYRCHGDEPMIGGAPIAQKTGWSVGPYRDCELFWFIVTDDETNKTLQIVTQEEYLPEYFRYHSEKAEGSRFEELK